MEPQPRKIVRKNGVTERIGYSPVQIWRKSRDPDDDFPAPVQLGPNAIGWFEDEIDEWLASRPRCYGTRVPTKPGATNSPVTEQAISDGDDAFTSALADPDSDQAAV